MKEIQKKGEIVIAKVIFMSYTELTKGEIK